MHSKIYFRTHRGKLGCTHGKGYYLGKGLWGQYDILVLWFSFSVIVVVVVGPDIDILNHGPNSSHVVYYTYIWHGIHITYYSDLANNLINPFSSEAHEVGLQSRMEFLCRRASRNCIL